MPPAAVGDGSCCTTGRGRTWACCGSTWAAMGGWWICTPTFTVAPRAKESTQQRQEADRLTQFGRGLRDRMDPGVLAASQGKSGEKFRHRSGPAREAPATGQGENLAGCQQVSGSGVLAGVERAVCASAGRRDGHASGADATAGFGECAEPCRATAGQQRLHLFV